LLLEAGQRLPAGSGESSLLWRQTAITTIVLLDAMEKKRLSPSVMAGCLGEEAAMERRGKLF